MKQTNLLTYWLFSIGFIFLSACASTPSEAIKSVNDITAPVPITAQSLRAERLDAVLAEMVSGGHVAGVSVLILEDGKESYYHAEGFLDREAKTPLPRTAVGRYYSMTKPIVGVALMQLYEDGKFALDDPLSKYLPEYANMKVYAGADASDNPVLVNAKRSITIRDLMRHTSGLTYGFIAQTPVDIMYLKADVLSFDHTTAEFSQKLAVLPLAKQPGEQFVYSLSTDVSGRLIEVLSGQSLGEYLEQNIFAPLGMSHTRFRVKAKDKALFGPVYGQHEGALVRLADGMEGLPFDIDAPFLGDMPYESGGGGLVSTLDDYAKFTLMLRDKGGVLIKPETHAMMITDQLGSIDNGWLADDTSFGLNFALKTSDPVKGSLPIPKGSYYWGGMAGTYFWVDPTNDLIFIMHMQMISRSENVLRAKIAKAVYGE